MYPKVNSVQNQQQRLFFPLKLGIQYNVYKVAGALIHLIELGTVRQLMRRRRNMETKVQDAAFVPVFFCC